MTAMMSVSARITMLLPADDTGASQLIRPSGDTGMFIHRLKDPNHQRRLADGDQRHAQIVGAVVMVCGTSQHLIARPVAAGDDRVMNTRTVIRDDPQHRPPPVADHHIANRRHDTACFRMAMRHRQDFPKIAVAESPEVTDLCAMRVDHPDRLAGGDRTATPHAAGTR